MSKKSMSVSIIGIMIIIILCIILLKISFDGKTELLIKDADQLVFAMVLKGLESEHWQATKDGAEQAAKKYGIELIVMAPDKETLTEMQLQIIHDLIREKVDGLAIASCDSVKVIDVIDEAALWDIPVFTLDTNASVDEKVVSFIGTDNYYAGKMAGQRLMKILKDTGKVIVLTGSMDQQTHVDRFSGFTEAISSSDIQIIQVEDAQSESEIAFDKTLNILKNENDIQAVFATNALMAMGAYEAIKIEGRDVKVIGFDIQKELLTYIKEGGIDSIISQDPFAMGYKTVETFVQYMYGESVEKSIVTESNLISKDNLTFYMHDYKNRND